MSKYKCHICDVTADIDKEKKTITVFLTSETRGFPTHPCELAKAVDSIQFDKLKKVE